MFGATRKSKNATLALKRHFWAHWMVSQAKTFSQAGERWVGIASWRLTQHHLSTWISGARKCTIATGQCSVAQSGSGKLRALAFINETMNQNINNHFPWFTTILPGFYQFHSSWMKNPRVKSRKNCCRPEYFYGEYYFLKTKLSWYQDVIQILVYPKIFECYIRPSKK